MCSGKKGWLIIAICQCAEQIICCIEVARIDYKRRLMDLASRQTGHASGMLGKQYWPFGGKC